MSSLLNPPVNSENAGSSAENAVSTPFRLGHQPWLDALRGIAVLLVLAYHFKVMPGGSLGVDIFFVLSGFLITTLLVQEFRDHGSISLWRFYGRRAVRLMPVFYLLLGVYFVYALFAYDPSGIRNARNEILVAVTYIANLHSLHQVGTPMLGHTWSLSVEEQFYLLWPLLLILLLKMKLSQRTIVALTGAGILASSIWRIYLYRVDAVPGAEPVAKVLRLYTGLDTRADALLFGCLLGMLAVWGFLPRSNRSRILFRAGAAVSAAGLMWLAATKPFWHSQYFQGLYTLVALMAATVIANFLVNSPKWVNHTRCFVPLRQLGKISYSLYLVHIPIIMIPKLELGWKNPGQLLFATTMSLGVATACYVLVERPCLRLKRWFQRPRPILTGIPADRLPTVTEKVPEVQKRAA